MLLYGALRLREDGANVESSRAFLHLFANKARNGAAFRNWHHANLNEYLSFGRYFRDFRSLS